VYPFNLPVTKEGRPYFEILITEFDKKELFGKKSEARQSLFHPRPIFLKNYIKTLFKYFQQVTFFFFKSYI